MDKNSILDWIQQHYQTQVAPILGDFQQGYGATAFSNDSRNQGFTPYSVGNALANSPGGEVGELALGAMGLAKPLSRVITKIPKRYSAGAISDAATVAKNGSYQLKGGLLKQIYQGGKLVGLPKK